MKKLWLLMILVSGTVLGQGSSSKLGALTIGGGFNQRLDHLSENHETNVMGTLGLQFDAFKGNFVLGPEVKASFTKGDFPVITGHGLLGWDNGKVGIVGSYGLMSLKEDHEFKNKWDVFQGILGAELRLGSIYFRGDWFTNLHTNFYSYSVQAGLRIKF